LALFTSELLDTVIVYIVIYLFNFCTWHSF